MRLLHTEALYLKEFLRPDIKYAIISHRWSEDEITLKEYRRIQMVSTGEAMAGSRSSRVARSQLRMGLIGTDEWVKPFSTSKAFANLLPFNLAGFG